MNEQPQKPPKSKNIIAIVALVLALFATAGAGQVNTRLQELSDKVDQITKEPSVQGPNDPVNTTLTSGKSGFSMTVPNGWGPMVRDTQSDMFIMAGMEQPILDPMAATKVIDTKGYGSDNASVFVVRLSAEGTGDVPRGTAEEFTIGKGDEVLVGKKYSYTYPKDDMAGIGYVRHQNDREYFYQFTTADGRKLDVYYSVYGSDPRNLSVYVDEIVHSIAIKK